MSCLHERGFTLVELVVALVVLAVLATIAAPNFQAWMARSRITSQANELVADVSLARSESATRGARTAICISSNGTSCTGSDWAAGRLVFVDMDGDGSYTSGTDVLLKVVGPLSGNTSITAFGFSTTGYIQFLPYGGLHSTAGNFKFCSTTISPSGTEVDVAVTGRPQANRMSSCS